MTTEIYDEMHGSIRGLVGECIETNKTNLVLEIGDDTWDFAAYASVVAAMQTRHRAFISENRRNVKGTVGLADISIVALAKALDLPVVSMEKPILSNTSTKRKIPNVCGLERVEHRDFNTFLRREEIGF